MKEAGEWSVCKIFQKKKTPSRVNRTQDDTPVERLSLKRDRKQIGNTHFGECF
jgi:hypothetical protein